MTFYFYDVETSGFSPRRDRIMQFAGQRTDENLRPIGKPDNVLIKLTPDILPEPQAVLVTGITPQQTLVNGVSEAEFLRHFFGQIVKPNTIFVGYNNIRFDDEFMRFLMWRNFYDSYEWHWKDSCSRWDLLDTVRMTRALRPAGIMWPFAPDGQPSNRLAFLSNVNKLEHETIHDALSDVGAAIAVAKLLKNKQPKLFDYLLNLRDKSKVAALTSKGDPLLYTSGRYSSDFEKTTIVIGVTQLPDKRGALMYDLRVDPEPYLKMSAQELAAGWQARGEEAAYFPVKLLSYNRSPAVAPIKALDRESRSRLRLDLSQIKQNLHMLLSAKNFSEKLLAAHKIVQPKAQQQLMSDEQLVDEQLYDGFVSSSDKTKMSVIRAAGESQLANLQISFDDERLNLLLPLYKARNYPASLSAAEQKWWQNYRTQRLADGGQGSRSSRYYQQLAELGKRPDLSREQEYLLKELKLYADSILPLPA